MFYLEIYKTYRSGYWWLIVGLMVISFLFIFIPDIDADRFIYNPLLGQEDMAWMHIGMIYSGMFLTFLCLPVIILFFNLLIFQDRNANLLSGLNVFHISKIKFWVHKFIYLQVLTFMICILFLCLPPFFHALLQERSAFLAELLVTGIFLSVRTWVTMLATTTSVFIFCIVFPKMYQSLLAGLGLIIWTTILPFSPVVFLAKGSISFYDLSLDRQPMEWTATHFHWEILSLKWTLIMGLLFALTVFSFRGKTFFRHMFFLFVGAIVMLSFISCSDGNGTMETNYSSSQRSRDSLLLEWIDTVTVMDQHRISYKLKTIMKESSDLLIYLDFWNSYCVPCMKAFPVINELTTRYTQNELKVLFLNTDENPVRWKRALDFTSTAGHPDHYRIMNPEFELMRRIGLDVYPRYLVLDRNGSIINYRAAVPYPNYVDSLLRAQAANGEVNPADAND